ncbi:MAG: small, acid-soluble spore protein, alpha/beta type [Bacillota bacterium]
MKKLKNRTNLGKFKYEIAQEMGLVQKKKNNSNKIDNSKENR